MNEPALILTPSPLAREEKENRNPVGVYLARLSPGSRRTMSGALRTLAGLMGAEDPVTFRWERLRYEHCTWLRSELAEKYAPSTANKILAALRGVLGEAFNLGLMSAEDFERSRQVKRVKGERVGKGRAVAQGELRAMFECLGSDENKEGSWQAQSGKPKNSTEAM